MGGPQVKGIGLAGWSVDGKQVASGAGAISAPTSLAIEVAERCGITLCAFVRGTRATVFTHPRRVVA